jgi:hypothetical protein
MFDRRRCHRPGHFPNPRPGLTGGRYSSTEPLSSARNPILTVRSTEVVRLALSSGHPILRHCPPLGPWALPRRYPLCESHGPGAGRPIQLTTARLKSTVTFRTFLGLMAPLQTRGSKPSHPVTPALIGDTTHVVVDPPRATTPKIVMRSHHVGPNVQCWGRVAPSACGAQQHGRAVRRRLGCHRTATQSVKFCPGPCRHHSSMKDRSRCSRSEAESCTAGLTSMLTIP